MGRHWLYRMQGNKVNWNKPLISEEDPGIAYGQKLYEKRPGRMEGHCSLKAKQSKNKQKTVV